MTVGQSANLKEHLLSKIYAEMIYMCSMRIEDSMVKSVFNNPLFRDL